MPIRTHCHRTQCAALRTRSRTKLMVFCRLPESRTPPMCCEHPSFRRLHVTWLASVDHAASLQLQLQLALQPAVA